MAGTASRGTRQDAVTVAKPTLPSYSPLKLENSKFKLLILSALLNVEG
jgi:hypothetical protein